MKSLSKYFSYLSIGLVFCCFGQFENSLLNLICISTRSVFSAACRQGWPHLVESWCLLQIGLSQSICKRQIATTSSKLLVYLFGIFCKYASLNQLAKSKLQLQISNCNCKWQIASLPLLIRLNLETKQSDISPEASFRLVFRSSCSILASSD